LPEQIGSSPFGLRLQAALVTLTAAYRVSRRGIVELARDLFGVTLSTGAADAICQRASDALAGPHCQLQDFVLDQAAVHVDETGWRTRGEGCALWTATTPDAVFLQIAERCNRELFDALVGAYAGIVVSDRWNGFSHLDPHQRQVCWSHLQRDFRRHADGLGEQKSFGETGLELTGRVFAAWRAYQHEHHDRRRLQAETAAIQTELRALLKAASPKRARNRWHRRFANNLLKVWPALWTFAMIDGIEPTNNPAERALRGPGQIPQRADRLGRHETRLQQPRLQQLAEPLGVLDVRFPAGDRLHRPRIDEHQLEVVLENRPHRLPVHASGLHRNLLDPERLQPVAQRQQALNRGLELGQMLGQLPVRPNPHARGHARFMHIKRAGAINNPVHLGSLRSAQHLIAARGSPA
jgi:hypothetical protein